MAKMSMKQFESSENQQILRDKLIDKAKALRLTQVDVARLLGVHAMTINRFWRQVRDVDFRTLSIIESYVNESE